MAVHCATYRRLDDTGHWGVAVVSDEMPHAGTIVPVLAASGKTQNQRLTELVTTHASFDYPGAIWSLWRISRTNHLTYGAPVDGHKAESNRQSPGPQMKGRPKPSRRRGDPRGPYPKAQARRAERHLAVLTALRDGHPWGQSARELQDILDMADNAAGTHLRLAAEQGHAHKTKRTRYFRNCSHNRGRPGHLWKLTKEGRIYLNHHEGGPVPIPLSHDEVRDLIAEVQTTLNPGYETLGIPICKSNGTDPWFDDLAAAETHLAEALGHLQAAQNKVPQTEETS